MLGMKRGELCGLHSHITRDHVKRGNDPFYGKIELLLLRSRGEIPSMKSCRN